MERALAALAGSGLDSARFAVLLDPGADLAVLDRSMTAVLAVSSQTKGLVMRLNTRMNPAIASATGSANFMARVLGINSPMTMDR